MPWAHDLVVLVALLSLALYLYMIIRVAQARGRTGIAAPATSGHPDFERAFRIHYNTLEFLPIYLVSLWVFSTYVMALAAAALGAVWIIGRIVYMLGYSQAPEKRSIGFLISFAATLILFIGAIAGVVWSLIN